MKKKLSLLLISTGLLFGISCTQAPKADEAKTGAPQEVPAAAASDAKMAVDVNSSVVTWIGTKPVGQHNGVFKLKDGVINVSGNQVVGGTFTIDMNSLTVLDGNATSQGKLAGHLKSGDFFETDKNPESKFEITAVQPYTAPADTTQKALLPGVTHTVTGNLTIKGNTQSVSFPAILNVTVDAVTAKANFNIDRTKWQLSYGNDKSLGDKFIRPEVNIGLSIAAHK